MDITPTKEVKQRFTIFKQDIRDFIGVFDTDFDTTPLLNYFNRMKKLNKSLVRGIQNKGDVVKDEAVFVNVNDDMTDDMTFVPDVGVASDYNYLVGQCLKSYMGEYQVLSKLPSIQYTLNIQRTKKCEGYHNWHFEKMAVPNTLTRHLTTMVYLNDVEDGGETEFLYQSRRVKPRKGRVVIFPVQWTHTHRGNPPLSGDKIIATTWLHLNASEI